MQITIRTETASDAPRIDALIAEAFLGARHSSHTEQFIVRQLREAGQLSVSLVAEIHGDLAGHVAASPVSISDGSPGWHGLGPVAVRPDLQRRGIGSRLIRRSLQLLREGGAAGCVVLGEPAYYGRFGFRPDAALTLPGVPPGYFQSLAFAAGAAQGVVQYHRAFEATG